MILTDAEHRQLAVHLANRTEAAASSSPEWQEYSQLIADELRRDCPDLPDAVLAKVMLSLANTMMGGDGGDSTDEYKKLTVLFVWAAATLAETELL